MRLVCAGFPGLVPRKIGKKPVKAGRLFVLLACAAQAYVRQR